MPHHTARSAPIWIVLALAAAALLLARLETLVVPLLLGWFLAYALDPVIDRLEARRVPRAAGVLILLAAVLLATVAVALLVVPALSQQLKVAAAAAPKYFEAAQRHLIPRLEGWLGRPLPTETSALLGEAARALQEGGAAGPAAAAARLAGRAFAGAWGLASSVLGLALIPIFAFYLLIDFNGLGTRLVALAPAPWRPAAGRVLERSDEVLSAFVRGQLLVCAVLAGVYSVGLTLTGIDMPWVVGLCSGALFIVPYLGTVVGIVAGSVLALLKFQDFVHLLGVWAVFAVGQGLEGFLLTPRIVGNRVGLHPLAVLVAVIAGGEFFGFLGVLLAVPAAAVLRVGAGEALAAYRRSAWYRGEAT